MPGLAGRIVLITGAPAGIGPLLGSRLAMDGAWIGVNFRRDLEGAKQLVDAIRCDGGRAMLVPGDSADPAGAWSILERVDLQWGPPDVVVEQSGSEDRPGAHLWPPIDRPNAAFELVRAALPILQRNPNARIGLIGPSTTRFTEMTVHAVAALDLPRAATFFAVHSADAPSNLADAVWKWMCSDATRRTPANQG